MLWHQAGGPDIVQNGMALCRIHHRALDVGGIGVEKDHRVIVSPAIVGSTGYDTLFGFRDGTS